jgi:hypothetical protein
MRLYCTEPDSTDVTIYLASLSVDIYEDKYYYDAQVDGIVGT